MSEPGPSIRSVVFNVEGGEETCLAKRVDRLRQRDQLTLATAERYDEVLASVGLSRGDVAYCATTGEGEVLHFHTGHFYSMTTHARGELFTCARIAGLRSTPGRCTAARYAWMDAARCSTTR